MRQLFVPFSAYRYQFCTLLPIHTHQYAYVSIFPSSTSSFFSVNVEIIVRNVTINDVQLQNSNSEFGAFCQFRIHKVISNKNSTLMDSTLLNKCAKFGAKIFRHY